MSFTKSFRRFWTRVATAIAKQSISFVSLLASIALMVYDLTFNPAPIPVSAKFATTGAAGAATGISFLFLGILLFVIVVGVSVYRVLGGKA